MPNERVKLYWIYEKALCHLNTLIDCNLCYSRTNIFIVLVDNVRVCFHMNGAPWHKSVTCNSVPWRTGMVFLFTNQDVTLLFHKGLRKVKISGIEYVRASPMFM